MPNHNGQELEACQAAYRLWAKANKAKALSRHVFRNRWLRKVTRSDHCVTAKEIAAL